MKFMNISYNYDNDRPQAWGQVTVLGLKLGLSTKFSILVIELDIYVQKCTCN